MSIWECKRRCEFHFLSNSEIRKDCKAGCEGMENVSEAVTAPPPPADKPKGDSRLPEIMWGIFNIMRPQPPAEQAPVPSTPRQAGVSPMGWVAISGGIILATGILVSIVKKK